MSLPNPPDPTHRSTTFWRRVHNLVAHPLMEVLPTAWGDWLHDTTAALAFIEVEQASTESEPFAPGGQPAGGRVHDPAQEQASGQETKP